MRLVFAHPEAQYFAVGKIDRDQVEDYHRRKGMDLRQVERWLRPALNYDPELEDASAERGGACRVVLTFHLPASAFLPYDTNIMRTVAR